MHQKLEVEVYRLLRWNGDAPVYRIYVNDEMLIERTFSWPSHQNYIKEQLFCNLDTGVHTFKLENLDSTGNFEVKNLKINDILVDKNLLRRSENNIEWRFIVDNLLRNSKK